mmetsp:Transcript_14797/g.24231  ORF Transcript_14797/g.24231 Transcript_14797/m.24231 type:complete len:207 (-) Transcript_14797:279-899(-)
MFGNEDLRPGEPACGAKPAGFSCSVSSAPKTPLLFTHSINKVLNSWTSANENLALSMTFSSSSRRPCCFSNLQACRKCKKTCSVVGLAAFPASASSTPASKAFVLAISRRSNNFLRSSRVLTCTSKSTRNHNNSPFSSSLDPGLHLFSNNPRIYRYSSSEKPALTRLSSAFNFRHLSVAWTNCLKSKSFGDPDSFNTSSNKVCPGT